MVVTNSNDNNDNVNTNNEDNKSHDKQWLKLNRPKSQNKLLWPNTPTYPPFYHATQFWILLKKSYINETAKHWTLKLNKKVKIWETVHLSWASIPGMDR